MLSRAAPPLAPEDVVNSKIDAEDNLGDEPQNEIEPDDEDLAVSNPELLVREDDTDGLYMHEL